MYVYPTVSKKILVSVSPALRKVCHCNLVNNFIGYLAETYRALHNLQLGSGRTAELVIGAVGKVQLAVYSNPECTARIQAVGMTDCG